MKKGRLDQLRATLASLGDFQTRGPWRNYRCPFHEGSRYNFGVRMDKGWYTCLGCGESGSLDDLVRKLDVGQDDAPGLLARLYPDDAEDGTPPPAEREVVPAADLHAAFVAGYTPLRDAQDTASGRALRKYLLARNVLDACTNRDVFPVGLHDTMPGRAVFPFIQGGFTRYFVARDFTGAQMKVLNPKAGEAGWSSKGAVLYNEDALRNKRDVVLCEGIFDAISVQHHARIPATCLLGKTISDWQIRRLRFLCSNVYVLLDHDARKDAVRLCARLVDAKMTVHLCEWREQDGKDPNECDAPTLQRLVRSARLLDYAEVYRLLLESA